MADAKRDRQRAARQAKIEAELAARKRAARQRQAIIGGAIFAVLAAVVLIVNRGDDNKTVESGTTTTTVSLGTATSVGTPPTTAGAAASSAAGKPCVARSQPLPEGAPEVDVEVGPPPTALVTKDVVVGTGAAVPAGATVTVNYIGVSCSTGVIFDSSYKTNPPTPATFSLSGVIPGWSQGIPGMNVGGKRLLGIPPDMAYGNDGSPNGTFAPQETLWFVVEMIDFKPAA
jgi:peptidylprolyl isomerase